MNFLPHKLKIIATEPNTENIFHFNCLDFEKLERKFTWIKWKFISKFAGMIYIYKIGAKNILKLTVITRIRIHYA